MEKSLDYDYIFKYILIGNASVGKSTILNRFVNESFSAESNPTMGVEFATKKISVGGNIIKIQIWDTVVILLCRLAKNLSGLSPERTIKMLLESCLSMISSISLSTSLAINQSSNSSSSFNNYYSWPYSPSSSSGPSTCRITTSISISSSVH